MDAKNLEILRKLKDQISAASCHQRDEKEDSEDAARWLISELRDALDPRRKRRSSIKKSDRTKNPITAETPARVEPKTPWPKKSNLPAAKKNKIEDRRPAIWATKTCRFCKSEFTTNLNWSPQPIMCPGCRKERKTRIRKSSKVSPAMYTTIQVFGGGSPGSGRRK